jgi:hypothetical protein
MFLHDLVGDPAVCIPHDSLDLPDFVRLDYPFDLPPYRRPFFTRVFEAAGVPKICPVAACRRSRRCEGKDGPPCYHAHRQPLSRLLLKVYVALNFLNEEGFATIADNLQSELGGGPIEYPSFLWCLVPVASGTSSLYGRDDT